MMSNSKKLGESAAKALLASKENCYAALSAQGEIEVQNAEVFALELENAMFPLQRKITAYRAERLTAIERYNAIAAATSDSIRVDDEVAEATFESLEDCKSAIDASNGAAITRYSSFFSDGIIDVGRVSDHTGSVDGIDSIVMGFTAAFGSPPAAASFAELEAAVMSAQAEADKSLTEFADAEANLVAAEAELKESTKALAVATASEDTAAIEAAQAQLTKSATNKADASADLAKALAAKTYAQDSLAIAKSELEAYAAS